MPLFLNTLIRTALINSSSGMIMVYTIFLRSLIVRTITLYGTYLERGAKDLAFRRALDILRPNRTESDLEWNGDKCFSYSA